MCFTFYLIFSYYLIWLTNLSFPKVVIGNLRRAIFRNMRRYPIKTLGYDDFRIEHFFAVDFCGKIPPRIANVFSFKNPFSLGADEGAYTVKGRQPEVSDRVWNNE